MKIRFESRHTVLLGAFLILVALFAPACATRTAAAPPELPAVEVVPVEQRDVPIYHEWIGTLDGMVNAVIKAQVTGYLLTQNYTEGSFVKQNQLLFQIDPRPFQAAVDQAEGQLAQADGQLAQARAQLVQAQAQLATAQANQHKAQLDEDRYAPLARDQAVTQQDLDNATQTNLAAKSQVEAGRAQVETARAQIQAAGAAVVAATAAVQTTRVNLGFTRLVSPIDVWPAWRRHKWETWSARRAIPSPRYLRSIPSRPISQLASRSISTSPSGTGACNTCSSS